MNKYRKNTMYYDDKTQYHIEKYINGKWVLQFGGLTSYEADAYLRNPDAIEAENKRLKIGCYLMLSLIIIIIILIILYSIKEAF